MIAIKPSIEILTDTDYETMLKKIERAGRVCYKSEDRSGENTAESFIRGIIKRGHESVIEHESITVRIVCDRGVSHELVRHRLASYSQESTRYCNYSADKFSGQITCIDPSTAFGYCDCDVLDRQKRDIWRQAMEDAERAYLDLLKAGARPEEARGVLPNALKTEIVVTMDLREWRHFLRLRTSRAAHPQMAEIANMILEEFQRRYPVFFQDIGED
jgi:thymidylate synthase (FAD)